MKLRLLYNVGNLCLFLFTGQWHRNLLHTCCCPTVFASNMSCWQNIQLCCGACRICLYMVFILESFDKLYRVAQIKIPHWTKCNFSTTMWGFYTKISWFIWERSCYNSEFKKTLF